MVVQIHNVVVRGSSRLSDMYLYKYVNIYLQSSQLLESVSLTHTHTYTLFSYCSQLHGWWIGPRGFAVQVIKSRQLKLVVDGCPCNRTVFHARVISWKGRLFCIIFGFSPSLILMLRDALVSVSCCQLQNFIIVKFDCWRLHKWVFVFHSGREYIFNEGFGNIFWRNLILSCWHLICTNGERPFWHYLLASKADLLQAAGGSRRFARHLRHEILNLLFLVLVNYILLLNVLLDELRIIKSLLYFGRVRLVRVAYKHYLWS